MKDSFSIAYGESSYIDATSVKLLKPLEGLYGIRRSKVRYDPDVDLVGHIIPKGSNKISVSQGSPIRCVKLGRHGNPKVLVYLIMDMDNSYLAEVDDLNMIQNVTICKGYNPFSFLCKNFTADEYFLSVINDFYRVPLSKSIYDFIIRGGRYAIFESTKNNHVVAPIVCKRQNMEDVTTYSYKILGIGSEEYLPPFIEYVSGRFARIIQITDGKKVMLDEHDLKSDSEMRWVTNFRWPSLNSCVHSLYQYSMIKDFTISDTLRIDGYISDHIFNVVTRNSRTKSFIYDPISGYMNLVL